MMFILLYFRLAAASDLCSKAVYFDLTFIALHFSVFRKIFRKICG
jgi:hypothetical protein